LVGGAASFLVRMANVANAANAANEVLREVAAFRAPVRAGAAAGPRAHLTFFARG
jgi:hypothetical protein